MQAMAKLSIDNFIRKHVGGPVLPVEIVSDRYGLFEPDLGCASVGNI